MIESLTQLKKKKICVIGDFMLDSYTKGSVKRISPEAPVCVLKVKKQEMLPGGAGNVVLNCLSLGAEVLACGRVGLDFASGFLKNALEQAGACTEGLLLENEYETPLKNRFMAGYQQLLRVDFENDQILQDQTMKNLLEYFQSVFATCDLVLISDYNKGLFTKQFLEALICLARRFDLPIFVDPKGHDFSKYQGVTLIKPNLQEAYLASGFDDKSSLDDVARSLMSVSKCQYLLITRSEKGMSLFDHSERQDFAAMAKEVIDVTGAGDTVISTLAVAYASGLDLSSAVRLSNIAASCAIEKLGCVHVGKKELAKAVSKIDPKLKYTFCLSEELLQMLFDEERILRLDLKEENLDLEFLINLSKLKAAHPDHLVAVTISDESNEGLIHSLADLVAVDFIIPQRILENIASANIENV